jgi:hypothetical protein
MEEQVTKALKEMNVMLDNSNLTNKKKVNFFQRICDIKRVSRYILDYSSQDTDCDELRTCLLLLDDIMIEHLASFAIKKP